MIEVTFYNKLSGTDAEELWRLAFEYLNSRNMLPHGRVTACPPNLFGWVGYVDGQPAGLQATYPTDNPETVFGALSWVKPEYRGSGVFRAIQKRMLKELLARGVKYVASEAIKGETSDAMSAAIQKGAGVVVGERTIDSPFGPITYIQHLRTLENDTEAMAEYGQT